MFTLGSIALSAKIPQIAAACRPLVDEFYFVRFVHTAA